MLTTDQINDLHRLYWSEHWPIRKIERYLHMGWQTIQKYLDTPAQTAAARPRLSKLDPYKATIAELLEKDPTVSASVIGQRIRAIGYGGGDSILRDHVHQVRPPRFDAKQLAVQHERQHRHRMPVAGHLAAPGPFETRGRQARLHMRIGRNEIRIVHIDELETRDGAIHRQR